MVKIGMMISDRYEIIEKIGTGGMSDVYKALDTKLNRNVAVKVLKQEFGDNENFVSKFRVEAQAAAGLMHSNIVNVYDVGEDGEIHYIVMELVEGITLKKYIEKKARLTYKEAVSIAIQVSLGIEAAHANHIIHRDIKPQNIIISRDGKVKVTDFGIAKAATSNTITSNVMGSVHYTSPEQARGGYSDEKSDIYSLGISMFEMITGRVPFNGETTVAIAIKHIQEAMPSPREYVAEIPLCVESIIYKCCEKSPDRRYQNMQELIVDLKQALLTPEVDFVVKDELDQIGGTRVVSNEELSAIKTGATGSFSAVVSDDEHLMKLAPGRGAADANSNGVATNSADTEYYEEGYSDPNYTDGFDNQQYEDGNYSDQEYDPNYVQDGYDNYSEAGYDSNYSEGDYSGNGLENEEDYSTKTERITTIIAIAAGVVIIGIIIALAVTLFNKMSGDKNSSSQQTDTTTSTTSPVVIDDENNDDTPTPVAIEKIMLPTLAGGNVDDVRNALFAQGIIVLTEYQESDTVESGVIISAKDASGSVVTGGMNVEKGATITLIVSSGKSGIELADVKGATYESAANALQKQGFTVTKVEQYDDEVAEGYVISQSPIAGETVPAGSTITLMVSIGPEIKTVSVPNLKGKTEEDAVLALVEAGLTVGTINTVNSEDFAKDLVCSQSITDGTYVNEGTAVDISISLGTAVVTYKYEANVTAPSADEDGGKEYKAGVPVKVVITTADGKQLFSNEGITTFPVTGSYYGLSASSGTITLTYTIVTPAETHINPETNETVVDKAETSITYTITRAVTFTAE